MKSKLFSSRNIRIYAKNNEIKIKILKGLFGNIKNCKNLRQRFLILISRKRNWGSFNRVKRRCLVTQRGRGVFRFTRSSRLVLRKLATQGFLPGIRLSSW